MVRSHDNSKNATLERESGVLRSVFTPPLSLRNLMQATSGDYPIQDIEYRFKDDERRNGIQAISYSAESFGATPQEQDRQFEQFMQPRAAKLGYLCCVEFATP